MSDLERERHKNAGLERARDSWYQEWFKGTERIAELQAELEALKEAGQTDHTPECEVVKLRDELALWQQAVGLASTCVPTMEVDVTDPIGMMQKVCAELAALKARLKWLFDNFAEIASHTEDFDEWCAEVDTHITG